MSEPRRGKLESVFASRRAWVAAITAAVCAFSKEFGLELSHDTITALVSLAIAWIVSDTVRETK